MSQLDSDLAAQRRAAAAVGREAVAPVSTKVGQCAEVLDYRKAGLLVPPADPGALAEALVSLLADEEQKAAFANRFQTRVADRYSEASAVVRISATYTRARHA